MSGKSLRAVAVICVRGDDAYLESCLKHLIAHGVDYAILDNGMSPEALALLDRPLYRQRLRELRPLPFHGAFELERQIAAKARMFEAIDADWLIHLDVDEVMHAYVEGERLSDSLARIEAGGFNVVNFDEYVFLPLEAPFEPGASPQPLTGYYLFDPGGPRLMRAWRKGAGLSMSLDAAGHLVTGLGVRLAPEHFVLRHYIVRDQDHARRKYTTRVYAKGELERGWHANRICHAEEAFTLPPRSALKWLDDPSSHRLDRSEPHRQHYWDWAPAR